MATKYYRYTLQGEHSADDALRALGDTASQGIIVRIDTGRNQTHVYVASAGPSGAAPPTTEAAAKGAKGGKGAKVTEVAKSDLTKIG